jgi:uncharacterized membrane protein
MKAIRVICCFCILSAGLTAFLPGTVLAQDGGSAGERIELTAVYPKVKAVYGETFSFEVELKYFGEKARDFDLVFTGPTRWSIYITPAYETEKQISAITLEPIDVEPGETAYGSRISVVAYPPGEPIPEPGEYNITLEVSSGGVRNTIDLVAEITAYYALELYPAGGVYNTKAAAGKDNWFSVELQNNGTAPIENIDFYSDKAEGWKVGVSVARVGSLAAQDYQVIDLSIVPPEKHIAGDYYITFHAVGDQASAYMQLRVTVETPTIWGWIGTLIIALVVGGLVYVYTAFRRR